MAVNSYKQDEHSTDVGKMKTLMRLFSYLLDYKKEILAVLAIMAFCVFVSLVNPLIMENAIDKHISTGDFPGLAKLIGIAVVLNVIMILFVKLRMLIMAKVCNSILVTIRQQLYTHIQTLDFSFFDSRPTGKILARIIGNINSLKDVLGNCVTTLIPDFFTICAVVVIMFFKNPVLAAASLISLPLMIFCMWFIQVYSHKRWQIHRKKSSNLNAFVHEDLSGIRIIQSFSAEQETMATFHQLTDEHRDSFIDAVRLNDAFGSAIDICWAIGTFALYFTGIVLLGPDKISLGILIAFGSYISMFWNPIMNLSNFYNQIITNIAGAERIFEILDTESKISDADGVTKLPPVKGAVTFDHVSFSYDGEKRVLDDVSFQIKPGETIALVGPTGAGKTTIVNLISRFYDIQTGHILIDDYDVQKISIESLRQQMGVMTQDNFLFSGTIKDNIRYGKLDATDEEIIAAAKAVNAHDFILKLEKGYDTVLSERGGGLSIGQKQLLAFARTMVSDPRILILDEATSSIDTNTEILVQEGIEQLLKGRTSFVIAHRLSTIQKADRIFVIDNGRIIEEPLADERPVAPKRMVFMLAALILGLAIPVGIVYLHDLLKYKIENREDVEAITGVSILAELPLVKKTGEGSIVVRENKNDLMEEMFRGLRTNLLFMLGKDERVILFSSTQPGEGKSFVAGNLAVSLAYLGKRVVVVGMDIRKPGLNKVFNISRKMEGITNYLSDPDHVELFDMVQRSDISPNLDILPGGPIPPNPTELVARDVLERAIARLKERYDYVILDTAPIGMVTDTAIIGRVADMCVYVCRADVTPKAGFSYINVLRRERKFPKLATVINGLDMTKRKNSYGYGYGKKYGYGKGYGYGYGYGYGFEAGDKKK